MVAYAESVELSDNVTAIGSEGAEDYSKFSIMGLDRVGYINKPLHLLQCHDSLVESGDEVNFPILE